MKGGSMLKLLMLAPAIPLTDARGINEKGRLSAF